MNQIPNIDETLNTKVEERVRELLYGHPQKYPKGSEEWAITSLVNMFRFTTASKETMEKCLTKQMVYIVDTLQETHHQQLQKAREEEGEKCIKVVEDYGKSMSKLHSEMIGTAHEDSKMMLAFDMHSRLIAVKHITEKMNHSELDQDVSSK